MASSNLYPPTVEKYASAFIAKEGSTCRIYFSLSKISASIDSVKAMHVSIIKQSSGMSVVNKVDNTELGRYRKSGIIMINNIPTPVPNKENLYYVDLLNEDIVGGWTAGWIYKIQIRLSSELFDESIGQAEWMGQFKHASNFSEWSTYCTIKAIGEPKITIPVIDNYDSTDKKHHSANIDELFYLSLSTLEIKAEYSNLDDLAELLYSYRLSLYLVEDKTEIFIETSDILYPNQIYNANQIYYLFKHNLLNNNKYHLKLEYTTINKFEDVIDINFYVDKLDYEKTDITPITIDNIEVVEDHIHSTTNTFAINKFTSFEEELVKVTSKQKEEDEGRIAIKLFSTKLDTFYGNICLRRSSSKDNFSTWTDIKIIQCNDVINNLDIIYDYTIESSVWYCYAVQIITPSGEREIMNPENDFGSHAIIREFEHSFLLGDGGRQLKLKFDNTMNNYKYNFSESKLDTIGGQYPFITRNGATKYRTFPINGLISFNMDEQNLFTSDYELYHVPYSVDEDQVIKLYQERRKELGYSMYDYKREFDFREKVLEFLQDGKAKLFKSPTEGNVIVRLMEVSLTPNQTLNRMIGSFTSVANEVAGDINENYVKYNFLNPGEWSSSIEFYETKVGQVELEFYKGDDIIQKIMEKYDYSDVNLCGSRLVVNKIHHLSLEFTDEPLRVLNNNGDLVLGNNIVVNDKKITVYQKAEERRYDFDPGIEFTPSDRIIVEGCCQLDDGSPTEEDNDFPIEKINISVNFLYEVIKKPYRKLEIEQFKTTIGVGQLHDSYTPGFDIFNEIYYKYYYKYDSHFRKLIELQWTCIEANPGAVFKIQDAVDFELQQSNGEIHEVGLTGILNLEDLGELKKIFYLGMRNRETGEIDEVNCDIIIDYQYKMIDGEYRKE